MIFSLSTNEMFINTNHILSPKQSLNVFQRIPIIQIMFHNYNIIIMLVPIIKKISK